MNTVDPTGEPIATVRTVCTNRSPFALPAPKAPATSTTTVYQDALARLTEAVPQVPLSPRLSNPFTPSTTELVEQAAHMMEIAKQCNVIAEAGQPSNPYATIGALRVLTENMHRWLAARLAAEERELLLTDRLRYEEQQERAHNLLMATDGEYAAEFEGEDDIP